MKTLVLLASLLMASPLAAQTMTNKQILPAGHYTWVDSASHGDIHVRVNLRTQMAYVYSGDTVIGETSVSTGRDGFETAGGHFTVLGKEVDHFSQHYQAHMPYTMWFNTSGEALHAGGDPGQPSSHGCVHLPKAFAEHLYTLIQVGDKVVIESPKPQLTLNI